MALLLENASCVMPHRVARDRTIVVADGRIERIATDQHDIAAGPSDTVVDLEGSYLVPGLIDLHVHGAMGGDFLDEELPLDKMVRYFHRHGVTGVLATLIPEPVEKSVRVMRRLVRQFREGGYTDTLWGFHSEGPFLNPEMGGGAAPENFVRPCLSAWEDLSEAGDGMLKMISVAPELEGIGPVIRAAHRAGTVVSAGHTTASYAQTLQAIEDGLSSTTHLFNAMERLRHRDPGVLLASLMRPEIIAQLNAEGGHVHPLVMSMAYQLKGPAGLVLTSDIRSTAGLGESGEGSTDALDVREGTIVGSKAALDSSVRVMVREVDVTLPDAVQMASLNPAMLLGVNDRKGSIAAGKDADLAVMDEDLEVTMLIQGGEIVYESETAGCHRRAGQA